MTTNLKNKIVLVVGLGKSGLAAARLLLKAGAHVTVLDQKKTTDLKEFVARVPASVRLQLGCGVFAPDSFDLIVVSPGVSWNHPSLKAARRKKIPVWPELELGWRMIRPRVTVAITGTNGKTTTTALIGHILKTAGKTAVVGGNIGTPLSDLAQKISHRSYLVLEVSSYQAETHTTFHPNVAVFLNLSPDHLARHKTMRAYAASKARLLSNAGVTDVAVFNQNDPWCRRIVKSTRARKVSFPSPGLLHIASHTPLRGNHNVENAMAAAAACRAIGLTDAQIIKGVRSFRGVPHRLQPVAMKKGVLYVNDSKGTNVDSTLMALKAFKEPVILILGGEHKGSSYKPLILEIRRHVKSLVAFGESKNLIKKDLRGSAPLIVVKNLSQAVKRAAAAAVSGDVVLFSPACASFDQYTNFEERGDHFVRLMRGLGR